MPSGFGRLFAATGRLAPYRYRTGFVRIPKRAELYSARERK